MVSPIKAFGVEVKPTTTRYSGKTHRSMKYLSKVAKWLDSWITNAFVDAKSTQTNSTGLKTTTAKTDEENSCEVIFHHKQDPSKTNALEFASLNNFKTNDQKNIKPGQDFANYLSGGTYLDTDNREQPTPRTALELRVVNAIKSKLKVRDAAKATITLCAHTFSC